MLNTRALYQCPFRAFFISMKKDEESSKKERSINALFGLFSFL